VAVVGSAVVGVAVDAARARLRGRTGPSGSGTSRHSDDGGGG
jgi:hypothetical protein